jgi:acyl carrier protein
MKVEDERAVITRQVIELKVREAIAKALELEVEQVALSASLQKEFDAQSLDMLDIAFTLEREFKVPFPQTDLLQRASKYFDDDALVQAGKVTDFGLELLRKGMPELNPTLLQPGLRAIDVVSLITPETFVRLVVRLLDAKADFPRECPDCGALTVESEVMPEFVCPACGGVRPLPSGDEVLLHDLVLLAHEIGT